MRGPSAIALVLLACASPARAAERRRPLAGAAISSRDWIIRKNPSSEEFTGDVRYKGGGLDLRSDWAFWDRQARTWKARGNVFGRRTDADGTLETRGDAAFFDEPSGQGRLTAKDRVSFNWRGALDRSLDGDAAEAAWDDKARRATFRGDVRLAGREPAQTFRAKAGVALLDVEPRTLRLKEGPPVVEAELPSWTGALQAEKIMAEGAGTLRAHGDVRGWLVPKKRV